MTSDVVFTLLYFLLAFCVIYPPTEFVSAGFTVPVLFSSVLGSEEERFIHYHIRKSLLNLLIYSLLPLGYIVLLTTLGYSSDVSTLFTSTYLWQIFATTSIVLPLFALYQIKLWIDTDYVAHPIVVNLKKFSNNSDGNWGSIARDIETEFRSIDKTSIVTNPITKIVATENWVLKVTPLTIYIAHQSDCSLIVKEANTYQTSHIYETATQYLNIEVKSARRNVDPFIIRINSSDFKDLQDRTARSINVLPNVKFHRTVIEQFVDVFKETIANNPKYDCNQDLDQCIGCLQARPDVKIQKQCENSQNLDCTSCYCRPMWCVECMAKWFASRQDVEQKNRWLSSKCTCPMCRATFCVLDVSFLNSTNN